MKFSPFARVVVAFLLLLFAGAAVGTAQILASRLFAWVSIGLSAATVLVTAAAVLLPPRG
ncbi:MAG TPA: hypothetical protein VKK30_03120 [Actinomycetota bacterium]|nr:hypothetical protein [Actinomycetota bacterium]